MLRRIYTDRMRPFANAKQFHPLRSLARNIAALCLIALLTVSASCLHLASHTQAMCNHCTQSQPMDQQTPSCCSVSHHPPAVFASTDLHQPAQAASFVPPMRGLALQTLEQVAAPLIEAPPHPPRIALRI